MREMMKRGNQIIVSFLVIAIATLPLSAATATLRPGARLHVRITERLSSDTAKPGDTFHGILAQPVVVNGKTLFEKGTDVKGQVIQATRSGRLNSPGELQLALTSISNGWFSSSQLAVQPLVIKGESHTKNNITKIGGGAAAGAIVGGAAAGGKGAAIGSGIGAGGGTVVAAATGRHEAVVESEALLTWTTVAAGAHPPTNANNSVAGRSNYRGDRESDDRNRDDDHYATGRNSHHADEESADNDGDRQGKDRGGDYTFGAHDREILRGCLGDNYSNLPPGLAKRGSLPPGLEKQLQRNGTLPPGLQKRVQPLPEECEVQLPRLPREWERVILGGQIIVLDAKQTIRDILEIAGKD